MPRFIFNPSAMSQKLKVSIVQTSLAWEAPEENRKKMDLLLEGLSGVSDLVLLPEMFTSGFTMNPETVAEKMDGVTVSWMKAAARKTNAAVAGSLAIEENGQYFNRLVWANPDGKTFHYNKRHLFTLAGEHKPYQPGKERLIVEYKGWRICPMICYDLRFPVWARNDVDYDLLLFLANWPTPRVRHWDQLLIGRAIENQCYVVGVNRIGEDNNGHSYCGHSAVVDYNGTPLVRIHDQEAVFTASLSRDDLLDYRKILAFLPDRDSFELYSKRSGLGG